jgi:hypothetical protein
MDLQKTKIYLDKLNREFARMAKDPDTIMRIDVDIMGSYVRELYDAILSDDKPVAPKQEHSTTRRVSHSRHIEPHVEEPPPPAVAAAPVEVEAATPPRIVQEEAPAQASPPPVVEPKPAPVIVSTPKVSEPVPGGLEILFEEKQAKELSEKLSELPIADLKKAIALNDRLLLTSELFAGDGKAFENAIGGINNLSNFEEAQAYLIENCVVRYAWTDKKRLDTAKNFIKLVRRRFK